MATSTRIPKPRSHHNRLRRLADVGLQTTAVAHESRNYLTGLVLGTDILKLELPAASPKARKAINLIEKATQGLRKLLDNVREYSAPMLLDVREESLADIWRRVWKEVVSCRPSPAVLFETVRGPEPVTAVDGLRLAQVFRNLFENSLAARPDGLEVGVSCRQVSWHGRGAWYVTVRDNGPGLTPEQRHKVFRPFYTTKTNGTGLGMAISRRIVNAHGGRMTAARSRQPGAEFRLLLPVTDDEAVDTGITD